MPVTKNQDLRIEYLDELLNSKEWTLNELLERTNQRFENDGSAISKRTLLRDLKYLQDFKGAPLHRPDKFNNRYYYESKFSLKDIPLDEDELSSLKDAITLLKQVDNFAMLQDVDYVIKKLENRIQTDVPDQRIYVQFEKHTISQGTEFLPDLLAAIRNKNAVAIAYQPYSQSAPTEKVVHPYLLKEFRNRWFLIGREGSAARITNYALDRIRKVRASGTNFIDNDLFNPEVYFDNLIGVSIPEGGVPETIEIKVYKHAVPYVVSKPIHANQEVLKTLKDGTIIIKLTLVVNYELKSVLLSYMDGIEVRKPKSLKNAIALLIDGMRKNYRR